jgi:hypothetical protein
MVSSVLGIGGCSEESNLWRVAIPAEKQGGVQAHISRAQVLYDRKEFDGALAEAKAAYQLDAKNEKAAVLLSQIHLAKAELDLFQMVAKLIQGEDDNDAEDGSDEGGSAESDSNGAAQQLDQLRTLLGLSTAQTDALILPDNRQGDVEGAPQDGPFKDLPVLLPKTATAARQSEGPPISHIHQAIMVLCPFVEDQVKILGSAADVRHAGDECPLADKPLSLRGQANFVWAVAHLAEAILFHGVILYQPTGDTPYLQKRVDLLDDTSVVASAGDYVRAVNELAEVVNLVFPSDPETANASMLMAVFNDLEAASRGFQSLPGVPKSLTEGISSALSGLDVQRDKLVQQGASEEEGRSKALKEQLTSGLAEKLGSQITAKQASGELSEDELSEVCAAYDEIAEATLDTCRGAGFVGGRL